MTTSDPGAPATAERQRPALVDAAAWSYVAIAVVNAGVGIWTLSFVPAVAASYERSGKPVPTQAIVFSFISIGAATLLFSGALIFFALRLRRGSTWARPALLTISLLSLAALLVGGGPGLIVILLCIAAAVVITRAPVTAWLRRMQGLPPG